MSSGVVAVHHRSAGARTMNNSGRVSSRILASLPLRPSVLGMAQSVPIDLISFTSTP